MQGIDKSEQHETDFESFNHPRIFIKYKQPINGYDVTVVCLPYNYTYDKERETEIWGNALLCFEKRKIADSIFTMKAFLTVFFIM